MSETAAVPPPANGLWSNSNYAIDEGGQDLAGLSVTIAVTQGITCQSATGSTLGFTFQLNAYSDETQSAWQQYVVKADGNQLELHINNWAATGTQNSPSAVHQFRISTVFHTSGCPPRGIHDHDFPAE